MHAEIATKAEATTFHLKMEIGVKNSEDGRILISGQKFECSIPMCASYGTYKARLLRSENLALEKYAEKLRSEMESNRAMARRLGNADWTIFSKLLSVKET